MLSETYRRVTNWNELRYDRVYNHKLAVDLLREEFEEYYTAEKPVDKLDAVCDIIYVALGILWKLNSSEKEMADDFEQARYLATHLMQSKITEPIYFASTALELFAHSEDVSKAISAHTVAILAVFQMSFFDLKEEDIRKALMIVCDSNDTKTVKKSAPDKKANDGNKGTYFIPPEPRLQAILDNVKLEDKDIIH